MWYKFSPRFLYFAFLNSHRWLNIANITPHSFDEGLVEPKSYSVDFSINLSFHLDCLLINFSLHIVGLQSIIYFHIYNKKFVLNDQQWLICHKTEPNQTEPNQTEPNQIRNNQTKNVKKSINECDYLTSWYKITPDGLTCCYNQSICLYIILHWNILLKSYFIGICRNSKEGAGNLIAS